MKILFLIFFWILSFSVCAQTDIAYAPEKADTSILKYKITILENFINNRNVFSESQIINLIERSYFQQLKNKEDKSNQVDDQKVSIRIKAIITDSINAKVFCEYIFYDDNSTPVYDRNIYLITTDGDLTHISQNSIDAEYNTFLFLSNETRKIYLGGKFPGPGSNANAVWLTNSNLWGDEKLVENNISTNGNFSYYSTSIEPINIPNYDFFGTNEYTINSFFGHEDISTFPSTYTQIGDSKNIGFKIANIDARDWGLNVYQQQSYNSLNLVKDDIVSAFEEMHVSFGDFSNNDISIELNCDKKEIIQGQMLDVVVKIKNNTNKIIKMGGLKHLLYNTDKDTLMIFETGKPFRLNPLSHYTHITDPQGFFFYNGELKTGYLYPGSYEYSIGLAVGKEKITSNKINFKVNPVPDSLKTAFNELYNKNNIKVRLNTNTNKFDRYEMLAEKYKGTFYEKEFYYKLLKQYNYYKAVRNKGEEAKKLRKRAIDLYKFFILKYPNSHFSIYLFGNLYANNSDYKKIITEIIRSLKKNSPQCKLLEVIKDQLDGYKEIKYLLK